MTSTTNASCLSDVDTDVTPSLKLLQYVIILLWLLYFDFDFDTCLFVAFKTGLRNVTQVVLELTASVFRSVGLIGIHHQTLIFYFSRPF